MFTIIFSKSSQNLIPPFDYIALLILTNAKIILTNAIQNKALMAIRGGLGEMTKTKIKLTKGRSKITNAKWI